MMYKKARPIRFERTTCSLGNCRSILLSYGRMETTKNIITKPLPNEKGRLHMRRM